MKRFTSVVSIISYCAISIIFPTAAAATDFTVSGIRFEWASQVYAPQSATENDYLVLKYQNLSNVDFFAIRFFAQESYGKTVVVSGNAIGVKAGTKGEIKAPLNYLSFLNVRGPKDYEITLCTRVALTDSDVCSTSKITFITEKSMISSSQESATSHLCESGGACKVGDLGPGGGRIVYVSPVLESWGRYIEVAPKNWYRGSIDPQKKPYCPEANKSMPKFRTRSEIGSGLDNSIEIKRHCPTGAVAMAMSYTGGGLTDWFLPSIDEIREVFFSAQLPKLGVEVYWYWTSTIDASYVNIGGSFTIESLYSSNGNTSGNMSQTNDFRVRPIRYGMSDAEKAEAKAKAEAEAKAKAEAEAKAKAEAEAKASLSKKRTITCVKDKLTKKVTAVNPKCPKGYKKK